LPTSKRAKPTSGLYLLSPGVKCFFVLARLDRTMIAVFDWYDTGEVTKAEALANAELFVAALEAQAKEQGR